MDAWKKTPDYDKRPQSDVDRENDRNNKITQAIEKGQKDFDPVEFEKWRQEHDPEFTMSDDGARYAYESYRKESKKDTLLEKASRIEEIEAELKEVQNRVWEAESEMDAQDEPMTSPAYDEDYHKMQELRKELDKAKDDYWAEKVKINSKRWKKELDSKPKVDKHDLDKLNEIADKYEDVNKYDMDDISRDYIKNRRNEMAYNKRNDEFKANHKSATENKIQKVIDRYNNPDRSTATLSDMVELEIRKDGERFVIVDKTETLGYTGGDKYERRSRERIEKEITEKLRKEFNDEDLYLEPDVPGRLVIASDKKELGGFVVDNPKKYTSNAKPVIKDHWYYAWVDEVDPNSELTESELEQMYRSIYPNRIKK